MFFMDAYLDTNTAGEQWWVISYKESMAEAGVQALMMPAHTFWTRCAEYDLDIENIDEVLDIVIGEFFAPEVQPEESLFLAPAVKQAREKLRERTKGARDKKHVKIGGPKCPLGRIKKWLRDNPPDLYEFAYVQDRVFNLRHEIRTGQINL